MKRMGITSDEVRWRSRNLPGSNIMTQRYTFWHPEKVLELAVEEARLLGNYIGSEHIFLGLK
jgi:hypothetical protein